MKTRGLPLLGLALAALAAGAAQQDPCREARRSHRWCDAREVGFVADVEVRSRVLYDALDAHGHDFDASRRDCEVCRKAQAGGGYCEKHLIGFVDGRAYLSRLTYHVFRGKTFEPEELPCSECWDPKTPHRWCEECGLGYVGNVMLRDREEFDQLSREYEVLLNAGERASICEICAAAMVQHSRCHIHRISFQDGKEIPDEKP